MTRSRATSGAAPVPQDRVRTGPRIPPSGELVNVPEFETVAKTVLSPAVYARLAGGDRSAFDRMTFRQRLMVNATDLDLTTELFGARLFAPVLVGPVSGQREFHPDGELETARGAAAANATMVVSSRSSYAIDDIAQQVNSPLWFQVYSGDGERGRDQVQQALDAGVTALCITVGRAPEDVAGATRASIDWEDVDRLRQGVGVPVLVKGIMTAEEASTAIQHGAQGMVVSNHGLSAAADEPAESPIDILETIVGVAGQIPVLIDGSFRRGSDILKALALGARAVLVARPAMWGLAGYGSAGVHAVLELLYSELARSMAASGRPTISMIDRALVKIHSR